MGHHIKQKINHNRTALERSVTEETNEGFESIFFTLGCDVIAFISYILITTLDSICIFLFTESINF